MLPQSFRGIQKVFASIKWQTKFCYMSQEVVIGALIRDILIPQSISQYFYIKKFLILKIKNHKK